jgi:hypothetical protein
VSRTGLEETLGGGRFFSQGLADAGHKGLKEKLMLKMVRSARNALEARTRSIPRSRSSRSPRKTQFKSPV